MNDYELLLANAFANIDTGEQCDIQDEFATAQDAILSLQRMLGSKSRSATSQNDRAAFATALSHIQKAAEALQASLVGEI